MTGWSWLTPEENAALDALWAKEEAEEKVIDALHKLRTVDAPYPPELLAARRAAVVAEIRKRNDPDAVSDDDIPTPPVSEHQDARNSRPEQY